MDKVNVTERKKMVLAMEYIARQINDEDVFEPWLVLGVADGDLSYGEWDPEVVDDYYIEDDNFPGSYGLLLTQNEIRKQKWRPVLQWYCNKGGIRNGSEDNQKGRSLPHSII